MTRGVHVKPRDSGLLAAITQHVYQSEEKRSFIEVVRCFPRVLEFNSSLGMEYNGKLYRFSAVKVKLVDSLILNRSFSDEFVHESR